MEQDSWKKKLFCYNLNYSTWQVLITVCNILKYLREQWSMANMDFFFQNFHWQGKLKPLKQILIFTILRNLQRSWVVMSWQVQGLWRWDNVTWHKLEIFVISCWKLLASVLFMRIQTLTTGLFNCWAVFKWVWCPWVNQWAGANCSNDT